MTNETIQRIVDAMEVKFHHAHTYEIVKPFQILGAPQDKSILFTPARGYFTGGINSHQIHPGDFYLIPKSVINYSHMGGSEGPKLDPHFMHEDNETRAEFIRPIAYSSRNDTAKLATASSIGFELKIHGIVNIFQVMGLPLLSIPGSASMMAAYNGVFEEMEQNKIGAKALRQKFLEEIMIHIMRDLHGREDMQDIISKVNYLLDRRLIDVVEYVQTNLEGDLSNNKIAQIACVTKDYVGQFFKSLTGRNLQDYIEERRLEGAYKLIRTTDENIQQIAARVGFKDPAYFSRRFKIKFLVNAKDVRKPEFETKA